MLVCKQTPRKNVQVVNRPGENTASDNLVSTLTFTQRDPPLKNAGYAPFTRSLLVLLLRSFCPLSKATLTPWVMLCTYLGLVVKL